jgi:hypothetical protein
MRIFEKQKTKSMRKNNINKKKFVCICLNKLRNAQMHLPSSIATNFLFILKSMEKKMMCKLSPVKVELSLARWE